MKKVLVTGAEGYIGSHLVKMLAEHGGFEISVMDTRFHEEYNNIECYIDYTEMFDDVTGRIMYEEYDSIVHLAGRSVVPQSLREPSEYYRVNTMGTDNLIESTYTENFIFASTSSAFEMKSPYARSKVAAEDIIKEKANGYTIFRFFNVSGSNGLYRQLGPASILFVVLLWWLLANFPTLRSMVTTMLLVTVLVFVIIFMLLMFALLSLEQSTTVLQIPTTNVLVLSPATQYLT